MKFDLIVIGAGHAGIEAALIAAKKDISVLMVTNHLDLIGQMSCNPSIGGIAKGNLVREIDALGGVMGKLIDRAGIHFHMLNKSKGAAVWGNRAQADKVLYRNLARSYVESKKNITIIQSMVTYIEIEGETVAAVRLENGERIETRAIVLAAGTFLNGIGHVGLNSFPCGRTGEPPSKQLTECIESFGIKSGRLKTGTSPRIDGRTVDFSQFEVQYGDENPWAFSFSTDFPLKNKVTCWTSRTNAKTHEAILSNLNRSPLYTGKIKSIGPRYCPSIEDKVVRFGEREGHALFLEPESLENHEMYLNGLSTSLPFDVQQRMVQSVPGLENAKIMRPGYGIEYDFFQPLQLKRTLETKNIKNLFFAGQINGTSGYEEAGAQGLLAGINAVLNLLGEEPLILGRDSSYIGVLIDDLVTRGTEEPYRMFTSRAEYRLLLRQDNCDERLMPIAYKLGFLETEIYEKRKSFWDKKEQLKTQLHDQSVTPQEWKSKTGEQLSSTARALDLLKRPQVSFEMLVMCFPELDENDQYMRCSLEADIKYEGFVAKQQIDIDRMKRLEQMEIPVSFNYESIQGILTESKMKLQKIRPATLGQASRISGITPSDISLLTIHLSKLRNTNVSRETMDRNV